MAIDLSLKVSNQSITSYETPVKIAEEYPTLSWDFELVDKVLVDDDGIITTIGEYPQETYEIRISASSINIGRDSFVGNRVQTGEVTSQEHFWEYSGVPIERGEAYYGQIQVTDETNKTSGWVTFSFVYNSLPYVTNASIVPSTPSATDDLELNYVFNDDDGDIESGTIIRWFKNGVYQRQFDNAVAIQSYFLQNGDLWNVDIYPSDGYECGSRVTSPHVKVSKTAVTVSNLKILPKNPNPNDFLKADYLASNEIEQENVLIRWYINDLLIVSLNNQQYIRPDIIVGDTIRFEVKHEDGGSYTSSEIETIVASDFIVFNMVVDGGQNPLKISSITPLVKWKSYVPDGKEINYVSIKIGTFYESDNVYSTVINYNRDSFTIPPNLLQRGRDYYISVAVSDIQSFDKYSSIHFRTTGSRWEEGVSNSTGWTLETLFLVPSTNSNNDDQSGNVTDYHVIRINDGDRFAEIRLYNGKIRLISGSQIDYEVTTTVASVLTAAGKNNDIKIYLNRELVIDGAGIFTQESSIKKLEMASYAANAFAIHYKYLSYTVSGYFLPGVSSEYANMQFHDFMEFGDNEIVSLRGYVNGKYMFGLNPDNTNESSTILAIGSGNPAMRSTVPRTFFPINKINKSPDEKMVVCAHAKGVTIITGYLINQFNHELIFIDENGDRDSTLPTSQNWEIVKNVDFDPIYFDDDGFNINTLS